MSMAETSFARARGAKPPARDTSRRGKRKGGPVPRGTGAARRPGGRAAAGGDPRPCGKPACNISAVL
jgi:hypothetical protein